MSLCNSFTFLVTIALFANVIDAQHPEVNDQFEKTDDADTISATSPGVRDEYNVTKTKLNGTVKPVLRTDTLRTDSPITSNIFVRIYRVLTDPLYAFINTPKVNSVLRNIATCVVNGAMELISFYFPAPLIPVLASLAGMVVPFEPVLMLRDRMPVSSYRRAFITAMNTFMGNFDKYKLEDNMAYDPYMTQRFNRRMMQYDNAKDKAGGNKV